VLGARAGEDDVLAEDKKSSSRDQVMATGVELTIRSVFSVFCYSSLSLLVRPFISIDDLERGPNGRALSSV
jgi:hypothetical protein